ncbi:MAG: hypothetical protein QM715_00665 [Nibricoccus sp.]
MRFNHVVVFAGLLLFSCAKKANKPWLYYSSGAGLNDAVVYVNENPTNQGRAFSHFVIEGVNWVRLKGEAGENGYQFRVVKKPSLTGSVYEDVINQESAESGQVNRIFSFNQGEWWRWTWQDADEIKGFEEKDLHEIKAIIREVIENAKQPVTRWEDILPKAKTRMWSDDPEQLADGRKLCEKAIKGIRSYKKLVYQECRSEDLVHFVGKQLVMVKAKTGPIFYVGQDEADKAKPKTGEVVWNYFIGQDEMFFAKFNGQWTWLIPTP